MVELVKIALGLCLMVGTTGLAYSASTKGAGLAGALDEPVSVRQESSAAGRAGPRFIYFGGRRHVGGSYGYGK